MPDPQFNGQKAQLSVHRVAPEYAHGRCAQTPARAAVLIHGRSVPGRAVFDLKGKDQNNNKLSVQEGLARAGVDTFVPDLLGYGRSTRFPHGLDDPHNASRPAFNAGSTTCAFPTGCDRTHNAQIFPLDQQRTKLGTNPLAGKMFAHSSDVRFATIDTWVRDIRQVIDDAIAKAQPTNGKVTLVGYSLGDPASDGPSTRPTPTRSSPTARPGSGRSTGPSSSRRSSACRRRRRHRREGSSRSP